MAIECIDEIYALTLISELGTDFTKWPTVKHFASWLRLCPNFKKTGGYVKSSKTRREKGRAAYTFRLAAWSRMRSKSYLGASLRRQRSRLGALLTWSTRLACRAVRPHASRVRYLSLRKAFAARRNESRFDSTHTNRNSQKIGGDPT